MPKIPVVLGMFECLLQVVSIYGKTTQHVTIDVSVS